MDQRLGPAIGVALSCALLFGCTSDGQVGENGVIRFSQVVQFAETDDFTAPIAAGRTVMIALQQPQVISGIDEETKADFRMEVRQGGSKVDAAWPLGFAQYAINIPDEGEYQLVAIKNGEALDQVSITVVPQERIRFSQRFVVATHYKNSLEANAGCTEVTQHDGGLEDFVLKSNQSITLHVVPEDEQHRPLIGLLPISATAPDHFSVNAQLVGHSALANSLTLTPRSADKLGEAQEIAIHEEETGETIKLMLRTSQDEQVLDCKN